MKRKESLIRILIWVCIFCGINTVNAETDQIKSVDIRKDAINIINCVTQDINSKTIYAGTDSGVFRSGNMGKSWERIDFNRVMMNVTGISIIRDTIYVLSDKGVYFCTVEEPEGKFISYSTEFLGISSGKYKSKEYNVVVLWTNKELDKINNNKIEKIKAYDWADRIHKVVVNSGRIFLAAGGCLRVSNDLGKTWDKRIMNSGYHEEHAANISSKENYEEIKDAYNIIDLESSFKSTIINSSRGVSVFSFKNDQLFEDIFSTTGLPSSSVRNAAYDGQDIYAATKTRVFVYDKEKSCWRTVFDNVINREITDLKVFIDKEGNRELWITGETFIYKYFILNKKDDKLENKSIDILVFNEGNIPKINEVYKMAIDYAEVSPEKIKSWRRGASFKAILPRVSLSFSESIDDNIEIYKNSSTWYSVTGPKERDTDWGIDLTWDLSDLIWNDAQTTIDVRSKLMVQLRSDILEEVARLYYERKRLIYEIRNMKKSQENRSVEKAGEQVIRKTIRIEEIDAYIDALTGGMFTKNAGNRGNLTL